MDQYGNPFGQQAAKAQIPGVIGRDNATEQRFRCLELALRADNPDHVKTAGDFYDFVTGKTAAERVADALKAANVG